MPAKRKRPSRSGRTRKLLEEAGCFAIVLEKIPAALAAEVTESVSVPTIGIGAGAGCSGQVLVTHDMLGLTKDFHPRFVRRYADLADVAHEAVEAYIEDVRNRAFPDGRRELLMGDAYCVRREPLRVR